MTKTINYRRYKVASRWVRTGPSLGGFTIESADLRYEDGYALRLRGVTTGTAKAPAAVRPRR